MSTTSPTFSIDPAEFAGKRVFVTGGSKGTGEAIVRRLAAGGANIVTTARSVPAESDLQAHFIPADLTTTEGAATAASAVREHMGGVDILVHNLGGSKLECRNEAMSAHPTQNEQHFLEATIHNKSMNIELPPVIAAFFHATNKREFADFPALFTADAHVTDESKDHHGAAIMDWIEHATAEAKPIAEVTDVKHAGNDTVVTATVSGNFPGSPIPLHYTFTLRDGKVARLHIVT